MEMIEVSEILKLVPIEEAIKFYGAFNLINEIGPEDTLKQLPEIEIVNYLEDRDYEIIDNN